ncbi:MAG: NAD(+)/NADH kinase [bacterium]|jgi:NAD+ kinase
MNIGIIPNLKKEAAREITDKMIVWLKERGADAWLLHEHAILSGHNELGRFENELAGLADCLVVLGGDGTLLNTARVFAPAGIPILGVNLGKLGFLTEIEIPEIFWGLERFLNGQYRLDERMMLRAKVHRYGRIVEEFLALNDTVVTKGVLARMIRLSVYIDETYVDTYLADGLILATPTGSTAYSLSAGGPLVSPSIDALVMTPICPHTLYMRSLLLPEEGQVKIYVEADHSETMLTIDGQYGYTLQAEDEIIVTKAECVTKLVRLSNRNFYEVLHQKLKGG